MNTDNSNRQFLLGNICTDAIHLVRKDDYSAPCCMSMLSLARVNTGTMADKHYGPISEITCKRCQAIAAKRLRA